MGWIEPQSQSFFVTTAILLVPDKPTKVYMERKREINKQAYQNPDHSEILAKRQASPSLKKASSHNSEREHLQ